MQRHRQHVLIAGGGVAALEAALALRDLAGDLVSVELLAPEPRFWYRPLAVAEPFALGDVRHYDLPDLAEAVGAAFTPGELAEVDVGARHVRTAQSGAIEYDALLVAIGATPVVAVPGALTFRGPADTERLRRLLDEVAVGGPASLVFAIPQGPVWSLPVYELALMTATWLNQRRLDDVALTVVTPEAQPLEVFGPEAAGSLREVLAEHRVALRTLAEPVEHRDRRLVLADGDTIAADHVVALPCLEVPWLPGLPQTSRGFITVDAHGRVRGASGVYAAGDVTASPLKHGGIAAQQAEAAAEAIAADAGADVVPRPVHPVLRGLLLTGGVPRYLRTEHLHPDRDETSEEPLWWPPAKVVGHRLAPFLAARAVEAREA